MSVALLRFLLSRSNVASWHVDTATHPSSKKSWADAHAACGNSFSSTCFYGQSGGCYTGIHLPTSSPSPYCLRVVRLPGYSRYTSFCIRSEKTKVDNVTTSLQPPHDLSLPLKTYFEQWERIAPEHWQDLCDAGRVITYPAGKPIFQPGEVVPDMRFICDGIACHYYIKPDGIRRNKAFLRCGDVASSLSSMQTGTPSRFGCEAITELVCLTLSFNDFRRIAESASVWQRITEKMLMRLALRKEAREADLLLLSPTELYLQFVDQHPDLATLLPNYHIASYLGISEVSLSRIRARLGIQKPYSRQPTQ